jgi:DNA-directed RNA polymerase alpha subunit
MNKVMKQAATTHPFNKLAKPAQRALANAGITTLQQLAKLTANEVMQLHGIGKTALKVLQTDLQESGLSFTNDTLK